MYYNSTWTELPKLDKGTDKPGRVSYISKSNSIVQLINVDKVLFAVQEYGLSAWYGDVIVGDFSKPCWRTDLKVQNVQEVLCP